MSHLSPPVQRPPSRLRRGILAIAAAAVGVGGLAVTSSPVAQASDPVSINLVTVNDFHGRLERGGTAPGAVGGAAALATAVKWFEASNPNTVFAAAGDLIGASTFTSFIAQDVPTIEALNAAGLDVSAVGNHELDQGWADLADRVIPLADWEYVAANLTEAPGQTPIAEYWTVELDGIRLGFIGAVTDELPSLVSPAGIAGVGIEAPVTAANRVADQLTDGNVANGEADVIILLVHEGASGTDVASATNPATRFGQIVTNASPKIDAIVSGHTHLPYNHVINERPVISSGQYGERFSNMVIQVDPDTKQVLSMTNTIYTLGNFNSVNGTTDDPTVAAIVAAAVANANVLGSVPLGSVTADFNRGVMSTGSEARGTESTLGNLVADVQLWSANQLGFAEIAFMNPGGLRADIKVAPDGVVTYKEAADVQSFANTLVTMTLTGAQVKIALEQQWQPLGPPAPSRPFLKLGVNKELIYVFDPTRPAGDRVTNIKLNGVDIDPTANYRVVVNSFLASGGDNFAVLAQGTNKVDTGKVDLQSMVDYFAALGTATPDLAQRSIGLHLSPPDADGYDPGDPITIDLSALDFTTNEPKSGTVQVSISGVSVGTYPVDSTLDAALNAQDYAGRAAISAVIPFGVAGASHLTVTVPSTGTTASVPITITTVVEQIDKTTAALEALLPGADKKTAKELNDAIKALGKASDPALWMDETHPASDKVFKHLEDAVKSLMKVKNPSPEMVTAIQAITGQARALAQTAIDEMESSAAAERVEATKKAKKSSVDKALKELDKGDNEAAKGKYDKAVDHYGHAWKHATKA